MNAVTDLAPAQLRQLSRFAEQESPWRIALEAELGARSFAAFFRMAWAQIDSSHLLWNWHIDLLCEEMEAVARRKRRNVVFAVPPRTGKSQLLSVAFPAWVWTWFPAAKFISASSEMGLAIRDAVNMRRLIKSPWYQRRWGAQSEYVKKAKLSTGKPHPGVEIVNDQDNKGYFENTARGHRFCCTPGSNVTGYGADFILCDDPHPANKAESDAERNKVVLWWNETIPTRLNEPDRGVKMVIQQRVHRQDLAGDCIAKGYHAVVLPLRFEGDHPQRHPKDPRTEDRQLLHPGRIDEVSARVLERALGPYSTAGQLQQRPAPRGGGLFKREWFQVVDAVPAECNNHRRRAWDLAATVSEPGKDPDYTVGVRMSQDTMKRIYIEDVVRLREEPDKVDMAIKATATRDGFSVPIFVPQDPGSAGKSQAAALIRMLSGYNVTSATMTGDKGERARPMASYAGAGNIYLVRGSWNDAFLEELCEFPNADHDDQLDAAASCFTMITDANTGMLEWMRQQALDVEAAGLRPDNIEIIRTVLGWSESQ